mgnify:FL=1
MISIVLSYRNLLISVKSGESYHISGSVTRGESYRISGNCSKGLETVPLFFWSDFMKQKRLSFYSIDLKYVRSLAQKDNNVMSTSPQIHKSNRPFVGVIVLLNDRLYCIPLTSPKAKFAQKKNSIDFLKICHPTSKDSKGAYKVIGGLNINNMLPVDMSLIHKIDIAVKPTDNHETIAYKQLMANQLTWCQANQDIIIKRANSLYNIITEKSEDNKYLAKRCCNFKKLEEVLDQYEEKQKSPITRNQIIRNAKAIAGQKHFSNAKDKSKSR